MPRSLPGTGGGDPHAILVSVSAQAAGLYIRALSVAGGLLEASNCFLLSPVLGGLHTGRKSCDIGMVVSSLLEIKQARTLETG